MRVLESAPARALLKRHMLGQDPFDLLFDAGQANQIIELAQGIVKNIRAADVPASTFRPIAGHLIAFRHRETVTVVTLFSGPRANAKH
jgi:hypothetical protein